MLWVLPVPFDAQRPGSHHSVIPAVISIMSSNGLTFPHSAVLDNGWGFKVTQRVCVIDRDPRNGGEHFAQVVWVACVTWNAFTLPEGTLQYRVHSSSVCQTLRTILVFRRICFPVWIPVWPLSCLLASSISSFIPHPLFSFLFLQVSFWGFFFPSLWTFFSLTSSSLIFFQIRHDIMLRESQIKLSPLSVTVTAVALGFHLFLCIYFLLLRHPFYFSDLLLFTLPVFKKFFLLAHLFFINPFSPAFCLLSP